MIQPLGYTEGQSMALLSAIVDTAIDAILIIDNKGVIQMVNRATEALLGYTTEEVQGKNVKMLMPDSHARQHDQYIKNYIDTGHAKIIGIGREVQAMTKSGSVIPVRLAVSEVKLEDERYFAGFLHDLSNIKMAESRILRLNLELEQKVKDRTEELQDAVNALLEINRKLEVEVDQRSKAEEALRESRQELEVALAKEKELSELKSRFVSMASHEFRTPLSTILSSVALVGRYQTSEQQPQRDKHISRIKAAVEMLNSILVDFLSLSRIEEGKIKINFAQIDPAALVEEVFEDVEGLLKPGQYFERETESGPRIVSDRIVLKNVLFNLITNAIKYSPEDKPIHLSLTYEDDNIVISIEDQGIGIPVEDQKYMFSRFFRASNASNIQGTGLGLNIVAGYLDLLGGSIKFTSELNRGSKFTMSLPVL